jgi:hypothetical protein
VVLASHQRWDFERPSWGAGDPRDRPLDDRGVGVSSGVESDEEGLRWGEVVARR